MTWMIATKTGGPRAVASGVYYADVLAEDGRMMKIRTKARRGESERDVVRRLEMIYRYRCTRYGVRLSRSYVVTEFMRYRSWTKVFVEMIWGEPNARDKMKTRKRTYRPISEAPKDGTPICAVVGGVEAAVAYDAGPVLQGWFYWDEDEGGTTYQLARPQPEEWREMF